MEELEKLKREEIASLNITDNNNEIHIKYNNEKILIIGSNNGPLVYVVVDSKMNPIEKSPVFEEELTTLLNYETIKAIDHLTLNVFKIKTDYKKATLSDLSKKASQEIVSDMLNYLADLHSFFNQRGGSIN